MANPFQLQSRRRKVIYAGLILGLFTFSLMHRKFLLEPHAASLALREESQGEVDLTSSALQAMLLGSRGFATAFLWQAAIEKQKKHQYNEMELLVRSIGKLQPHFASPWLFQGWNLAFNVSVECDQSRDKYFYISRGLQLLAEGERRNGGQEIVTLSGEKIKFPGNPEMRHHLGFFYQLKIGNSDEKQTMRCLLELSCIDPARRDPARFWAVNERGARVVDQKAFEEFCIAHPRLVRRLRDHLGREEPKHIVEFLEEHQELPSRFGDPGGDVAGMLTQTPRLPAREQFPILPPHERMPSLPDPKEPDLDRGVPFDVFEAARVWYLYAQEPLPAPPDSPADEPDFNPVLHRLPKMTTYIFRTYPARARVYAAEALQEEGWFDESGWAIRGWFDDPRTKDERVVVVGRESKYHAGGAWQRAYEAYLEYGVTTRLHLTPEEYRAATARAQLYRQTYRVKAGELPFELRPEQRRDGVGASFDVHKRLHWMGFYRTLTNFDSYMEQAAVERTAQSVRVRKMFFEARKRAEQAERETALNLYKEALPALADLFIDNPGYHAIPDIQLDAYEMQKKYLDLLQQVNRREFQDLLQDVTQIGLVRSWLPPVANAAVTQLGEDQEKRVLPLRRAEGLLDMIYLYDIPEPGKSTLAEVLVTITQAPLQAPLLPTTYKPMRMLVTTDPFAPPGGVGRWRPLLYDTSVDQARGRFIPPPAMTRPPDPELEAKGR